MEPRGPTEPSTPPAFDARGAVSTRVSSASSTSSSLGTSLGEMPSQEPARPATAPAPAPAPAPPPAAKVAPPKPEIAGSARFHQVLWHRFDTASGRIKGGLDSLATLLGFVKKRIEAEHDLANIFFQMTKKGSNWSLGGQKDLQDTVQETGRVLEAWEVMMRQTTATAIAHNEVEQRLQEEVHNELSRFYGARRDEFDQLSVEGKQHQGHLRDTTSVMSKARSRYYKACTEWEQASLARSRKEEEKRAAKEEAHSAYRHSLSDLNKVEKIVYSGVFELLRRLHDMETRRVDLMQKAMLAYVKITAEEMPAAIGEPVVAELQPAVEVIDARVNMGDWLDKAERSDAPVQPGRRQLEEYDQLEHCPDEQRGVKMLRGPPPDPAHQCRSICSTNRDHLFAHRMRVFDRAGRWLAEGGLA